MVRTLYSGNRNASSWAFRAWLALKEQNISFEEVIIDIRRPQRWKNLAEIGAFSPPAAVPVLVDQEVVIYDSSAIMEYANDIGDGGLLPEEYKSRAQARSLVAWQHSTLGRICPALSFESAFYVEKKSLNSLELEKALWLYSVWEDYLKRSGGPYIMGEYSLADIALLPSVVRLTAHLAVPASYPLTQLWVEVLLNRPYVKEWLNEAYEQAPIYLEGYFT